MPTINTTEIGKGLVLLSSSAAVEAVTKLPDPETVNSVMSALTQLFILAITIWRTIKKPKPNNNG